MDLILTSVVSSDAWTAYRIWEREGIGEGKYLDEDGGIASQTKDDKRTTHRVRQMPEMVVLDSQIADLCLERGHALRCERTVISSTYYLDSSDKVSGIKLASSVVALWLRWVTG